MHQWGYVCTQTGMVARHGIADEGTGGFVCRSCAGMCTRDRQAALIERTGRGRTKQYWCNRAGTGVGRHSRCSEVVGWIWVQAWVMQKGAWAPVPMWWYRAAVGGHASEAAAHADRCMVCLVMVANRWQDRTGIWGSAAQESYPGIVVAPTSDGAGEPAALRVTGSWHLGEATEGP